MKNLREINDGVAGDREGELSLLHACAFDADDGEGAGVENGGERGEPGLIVVLRAEIAEHGIGEVAFEEFCGPTLPFEEEFLEGVESAVVGVAAKEFGGGGRGARACIEEDDADFALGEALERLPGDSRLPAPRSRGRRRLR